MENIPSILKRQGLIVVVSSDRLTDPRELVFCISTRKAKIQPQILGGGQQDGMRSGTDNVPGIAGLGVAAQMVYDHLEENRRASLSAEGILGRGAFKAG